MDFIQIQRALLSVTHKEGIIELATFLYENNVELVSTGGTFKVLTSAGLPVTAVSAITGFPEILGGRVKTLHPNIHGGILADKENPDHLNTLKNLNILPFDLVCVNLYDFTTALSNNLSLHKMIEEIDIGGPCMLRAAAKNFHSILVLPDTNTYTEAIQEMKANTMNVSLMFRKRMAAQTFKQTASYDDTIATYLTKFSNNDKIT